MQKLHGNPNIHLVNIDTIHLILFCLYDIRLAYIPQLAVPDMQMDRPVDACRLSKCFVTSSTR